MKMIDMHTHLHWDNTPEQIDAYVKAKKAEGMMKVLLIGPSPSPEKGNAHQHLIETCDRYDGFFIPYPRLDLARPEDIEVQELFDMGAAGMKFIAPHMNYDDECFFHIYAAAEKLGMPILFHTGILGGGTRQWPRGIRGVSSARMKPEHLDTIGRAFPDLILHGAHLGNPEYEMALEVMRYNDNLYWDICGTTLTKKMTPDWWMRIQWDRPSRRRFLYATDEHPILPEAGSASHFTTRLETHVTFVRRIGWTDEEIEGYFYGNALLMLEKAYKRQGRVFSV